MNKFYIFYILFFFNLSSTPQFNYFNKENNISELRNYQPASDQKLTSEPGESIAGDIAVESGKSYADRDLKLLELNAGANQSQFEKKNISLSGAALSEFNIMNFLPVSVDHNNKKLFANIGYANALINHSKNIINRFIFNFFVQPEDSIPLLIDIQPNNFLMPEMNDTIAFGSVIIPIVSFTNNGSAMALNVPVRYRIVDSTGNEIYNESVVIPSIDSSETINITFPKSDSLTSSGTYIIIAKSEFTGDEISSNDSINGTIIVSPFPGDPAFTVTWIDRPVNFQLYARESNDSGNVNIQGVIHNSGAFYDTCLTMVYRNGSLIRTTFQPLSYSGDTANFLFTDKIKAERSEYKITFSLRKPSGSGDTLLYTADSIVSGDAYIINGQSNVYFAPTDGGLLNFKNEFIRTFGIQTDSLNSQAYNPKDTTWGSSFSFFNIATLTEGHPRNVGGIGQFLQKYILDSFNIPTCIINGSVNNTSIKTHTRNNSNPTALNTLYGKLLYRTQRAKLKDKIKAIIWFQGETDNGYSYSSPSLFNPRGVTDPYEYPVYFDSLYKGWVNDYDFERIYVFQIRQVACSYQNRQSMFREVQRKLQSTYHDTVQVIGTVGIGNRSGDNCHYLASGYDQLAHNLFRRLRQDFYSITDSINMRPPNIVKAFYNSYDRKQIGMIIGGSIPGSIPSDSLNKNIKNFFFLNRVRSSTSVSLILSNDTLILTMPESQSASSLSYLPNQDSVNIYNGPFIRNSKGIAMITFDSVNIEPYSGIPENDIQALAFIVPETTDTLSYGTKIIPQLSFTNNGSNPQTNVLLRFNISDSAGNEIYNDSSAITSIETEDTITVTFPESAPLTSAGNNTIRAYSELAGDQVRSNDSIFSSITVLLPTNKFIELRFCLQEMYPNADTIKVYMANSFSPYQIIDSSTVFIQEDSMAFIAFPSFANTVSGNYYFIIIRHRNSIETWSSYPVALESDTISYNFTSSADRTFGNNAKLVGYNYCVLSGDENQDGAVDLSDVAEVLNEANSFTLGYESTDMNGDNVTDLDDVVITSNSASDFVVKLTP